MVSAVSTLYVVGDRFAGFAVHTRALTLSSFLKGLRAGAYDDVSGPMLLRAGQGISKYEWDHIHDELTRRGLGGASFLRTVRRDSPDGRRRTNIARRTC